MNVEKQITRRNLFYGAIHGLCAWSVYGIVECLFSAVVPWLTKPGFEYIPVHWGFSSLLLFVIYPAIGFILGGLSTLVFHIVSGRISSRQEKQTPILYPLLGVLTVIFAFSLNLIISSPLNLLSVQFALFIAITGIVAIVLSLWQKRMFEQLRFLTNAWVTCFVLIGPLWLSNDLLAYSSKILKAAIVPIYVFTCFSVSFFIQKRNKVYGLGESSAEKHAIPYRYLAFLMSTAIIVVGISSLMKESPIEADLNVKPQISAHDHPNVILITMDTVRADHLSLYGYERDTTPNLRKFAEKATVYTRAMSSGDMTLTSHASIFTGMYGRRHGAHRETPDYLQGRPLDDKFHTLAEILSEKGYDTMGVVANSGFLSNYFGLNQGFQYYDQRSKCRFLEKRTQKYYLKEVARFVFASFPVPREFELKYRRAEEINKEVFAKLKEVKGTNKPFFMFINYMDAHRPYVPPPPFETLYPGYDLMTLSQGEIDTMKKEVLSLKRNIRDKERRYLISEYDGGITYIDYNIGKLIYWLRELGMYKNSLIIILADHGEAFGERNMIEHECSVYQDQLHIPLIIAYPNMNKANVINDVVSVVDIMPTTLDVLGFYGDIPEGVQGKSLLRGESKEPRSIIGESFPGDPMKIDPRFDRIERAIYSGSYKFISSTRGKRERYDLLQDPDEKENRYNTNDAVSVELKNRLKEWLHKTAATSSVSPEKLNNAAVDRLKALGYIQ